MCITVFRIAYVTFNVWYTRYQEYHMTVKSYLKEPRLDLLKLAHVDILGFLSELPTRP